MPQLEEKDKNIYLNIFKTEEKRLEKHKKKAKHARKNQLCLMINCHEAPISLNL